MTNDISASLEVPILVAHGIKQIEVTPPRPERDAAGKPVASICHGAWAVLEATAAG